MALVELEILGRGPYEQGVAFGDSDPYERIDAIAHFAVDPLDPANAGIVDLDKAARGPDGRVRFSADFCLLQPADAGRGTGRMLFEVANRGRRGTTARFHNAPAPATPNNEIHPGDGLLFRRGWSLAWCGWQWDVVHGPGLMGLAAPQALENGRPIAGRTMASIQVNTSCADHLLADRVHTPYLAADANDSDAMLSVREWADGPATTIPRERWRFARDDGGRQVEDSGHVWLEGGFVPGRVYELVYQTAICPIQGAGLLALRDAVSFLRHGATAEGNPAAGRTRFVYGFGASQTGRVLRHFLALGLNVDERRRQVFDGLHIHIAGARQGEFNQRYAQPSRSGEPGFGHLMPFAFDPQTDPLTGRRAGLLDRQRAAGGVPRIIATNSAAEYWRGDASLLHTDLAGTIDLEPPEGTRVYLIAGAQHMSGALPLNNRSPLDGAHGANAFNVINYAPIMRAALTNLDRWVSEGIEPPPSRFPHLSDGTAVPRSAVIECFRGIPGALPDPERLRTLRRLDLGPNAAEGVGRYPAERGDPYPLFASAVDADGNELGGVALPDVRVPLATYAGWNPRHPDSGGTGQILDMLGSTLPFPATERERQTAGDPRRSIAERYADREAYLRLVQGAARGLVSEGHMLDEDVESVVAAAALRYDAFASPVETVVAPARG